MTKIRLALVTAIFAATAMLTSTAEAGMKVRLGFGFPLGSFTAHGNSGGSYSGHYRKERHHHVRRKVRDDVEVTRKSTAAKTVAKAEPEAKVETDNEVTESENSSISTAAIAPVEEPTTVEVETPKTQAADEPKSAKKLDCKKFFPSVGMTLTVPCE